MWGRDTKLIDLIGGMVAGLILSNEGWVGAEKLKYALLYMGAFGLASIVCLWKNRLRTLVGWVLIAIVGAALCTGIQEYFLAEALRDAEPMVLFEGMWVLNLISKIATSLLVLGAIHYGGILLREAVHKVGARYQGAA
jgi:hypothetical protein